MILLRTVVLLSMLVTLTASGCAATSGLKRKMGPEFKVETHSWIHAIHQLGGNGKWLVTRGYHTGDDAVALATNSPLTHAAVLDVDRQEVVEAIGEGVIVTKLDKFLHEAHRMQIIEPKGWNATLGKEAVAKARSKVGQGYDFLGLIGLPSKERWYCSELAAWSVGVKVDKNGPLRVIHPRNMHRYGSVLFDSLGRDGKPDRATGATD